MKRFVLVILLIIGLLTFSANAAEKKVTIATLNWEPYVGQKLKNLGFTSDIIQKAFEKKGYTVEFKFYPWARGIKMTEDGRCDGIYPAYFNKEREKKFIYSTSFGSGAVGFYKRKDKPIAFSANPIKKPVEALKALKQYRIGLVRGYANTKEIDEADYLIKDVATSDETNLKKLFKKRLDLVFIDKYVARYIMHQKYPHFIDELEFMTPPLDEKQLYICFSRKVKGLETAIEAFNQGIKEIKASGEFEQIMESHGF
jgi:ABC-type amino acid transport substrate-binding protein